MDLNIYVPTRNNRATVEQCLASVAPLGGRACVVDFGSTDGTVEACERSGATVVRHADAPDRSAVLNQVLRRNKSGWNLLIYPWEVLVQGHDRLRQASRRSYYVSVFQESLLFKDVRLWQSGEFVNPIYEYVKTEAGDELPVYLYSAGRSDYDYCLEMVQQWKAMKPTSPDPYYYQACTLLAQKKNLEFLKVAEHYIFLDNRSETSNVMNRYYYAVVHLQQFQKVKPVLQNVNLCLCVKPLMAEFWCLIGDVYYHRLKKFDLAREFYENAMLLGSRRLKSDKWPMDLSKYQAYPQRMIESCNAIIQARSFYSST